MFRLMLVLLTSAAGPGSLGGLSAVPTSAPATSASATSAPYYGISLSELQVAPVGSATTQVTDAEVRAVHDAWHANTVRLQIAQDKLTYANGSCPLTRAGCLGYYREIKAVVNYALSLGLTVVINDTTDAAPFFTRNEPMPTPATKVFWKDMAAAYTGKPHVIFDLFNEPRGLGGTAAAQWKVWRHGGTVQAVSGYLGMQTILSYIRNRLRASNMVWADGLSAAGTLNGIARHNAGGTVDGAPGSVGTYALSQRGDAVTGPLVYTIHHPMGDQTTTAWWRDFGYLPALGFTVMDGEWNNAVDGLQYCWNNAPSSIPFYFSYLAGKHAGLTAWEIGPNVNSAIGITGSSVTWAQSTPFGYANASLADTPASYETPTTTSGSPAQAWDCSHSNHAGPGQLVMNWFAAQGG